MATKRASKKKIKRPVEDRRREERKKQFLVALEQAGGHIENACKACNIHRSSIYDWMASDHKFEIALNAVRDAKVDNVEAALYKNALEGNVVAQIFFLKTIGKSRGYVERQEVVDVTEVDFTNG